MKWRICAIWFILLYSLTGCVRQHGAVIAIEPSVETSSSSTESETQPVLFTEPPQTEAEREPEGRVEKDGKIRSYLTGEMMPVAQANRRPVAVMISNDKQARPQYGINRAGIIYEAPVEGNMNRFMAIFEDYDDLERIGSVRSCRTYYTYFAREFDAIYAHFGQSTFAKPYLQNLDNINGIDNSGGIAFFRSKDKRAPHNAYTSYARLQIAIEQLQYSQEYSPDYQGHFKFAESEKPVKLTQDDAMDAYKVLPGYPMNRPWFEYHEEDGEYYRYQYGAAHEGSEGPIHVKNIIIQFCQSGFYATTEYLNINVHTSESGYYITNGKAIPIRWIKEEEFSPTRYLDKDGNEITLNQGKTWVCIVSTKDLKKPEFYGKK